MRSWSAPIRALVSAAAQSPRRDSVWARCTRQRPCCPAVAGIAANVKPAATDAKSASAGIWKGCFVAPQDFRTGKKDGALLGAACRADRDKEIRAVLFPEELTMPPSCSIKAKLAVRARVTGNIGIYHLRGCPSYPATTKPDRWFCSEDDAQAAGFRKAYNCRRPK